VPTRWVPFGFAAMLNEMGPVPVPLVAPPNVIHEALLVAVH
jgi:hypothetical protein